MGDPGTARPAMAAFRPGKRVHDLPSPIVQRAWMLAHDLRQLRRSDFDQRNASRAARTVKHLTLNCEAVRDRKLIELTAIAQREVGILLPNSI